MASVEKSEGHDWYIKQRLFTYKLTRTMKTGSIVNEWWKLDKTHVCLKSCWKHANINTQTQSNSYQSLFVLRNFAQQIFSLIFCVCLFSCGRSESLMPLFLQERLKRTSYIKCFCQRSRRSAFSFVFSSSSCFFFAIEKWKDGGGQKIPMAHEKSEGKGRSVKKRGGKGQKEQR